MRNWFPILAIMSCPCFAQQDSIAPYYREFEDKIATQLFVLSNSNNFTVKYDNPDLEVDFNPNNKTTLNIGFQYDIIAFSLGFAPAFFADNRDNEGSRMRTFSFDFYPERWAQHLEYHDQKGMTLQTPGTSNGIYLRNMKSVKIGGSTTFFFNRKFSYRAITLQNVKQMRSAGSFSAGLTYRYTELNAENEPLIEGKTAYFDLALTPAYHYNWVIGKHINLAAGLSIGGGINFTDDDGDKTSSVLYTSGILLAPGYNSDSWFFGANIRANYSERKVESGIDLGDMMSTAMLFVGYRFDAPKFLTSKTQQIKNKFKKKK